MNKGSDGLESKRKIGDKSQDTVPLISLTYKRLIMPLRILFRNTDTVAVGVDE